MYYKLPVKERLKYMEAFRKANPGMSYHDMVKDYNNTFEKYGNGGKVEVNAGGEKHLVYKKESPTGNGKGIEGHIMVTHPTKDKGKWDTIDLTAITNYKVKTVQDGIESTKKWHEENPEYTYGGIQRFEDGGKKDLPKKDSNEFSDYQRPGPVASENSGDYFTWFRKSQLNEAADYLPMIQMPLYNSRKPNIIPSSKYEEPPSSEEPLPVKQNNKEFPKFFNVSNNQKPVYLFPATTTYQGGKEQNSPYYTGVKEKKKTNEDLRKELDIIQGEIKKGEFNPFKFYEMQKRAGEIYKILGSEKPELVEKETKTGQNAGKLMIASGKYIFPQASPLFNTIEGGLSVYDFYKDKNSHNIASLMTEAAPYIRRNNKYNKFYQLMGDYLTGQEVGLLPEDKK